MASRFSAALVQRNHARCIMMRSGQVFLKEVHSFFMIVCVRVMTEQ